MNTYTYKKMTTFPYFSILQMSINNFYRVFFYENDLQN